MTSRSYSTPLLEELGTFERLTQAAGCPDNLDATFPADTPFGDLTCAADGLS
ncbi:lasso RiPP family leader peptide-containing protein [Erythrobacter sp. NFXS35]|uniref:lasso RiPP family leader peptide-containing protein n=1 Tax=Erythrobacter sp. NFXS35 TaxID=2818436 RepID=UPI0032DF385B